MYIAFFFSIESKGFRNMPWYSPGLARMQSSQVLQDDARTTSAASRRTCRPASTLF
jgi:hypothetical protein